MHKLLPLLCLLLAQPAPMRPLARAVPATPPQETAPQPEVTAFSQALDIAERALGSGDLAGARAQIDRALERDAKSPRAWAMRARWADLAGERDELIYALHVQLRLSLAQRLPASETAPQRARLQELDPIAAELLAMNASFIARLRAIAEQYTKDGRPHSAIRVHKQILGLEPDNVESQAAIEVLAAAPDPSLAADAKPKDLLADVSVEWIREFDAQHATWDERARLERENYVTQTNAGYEVLVRSAEAMEQMNAFYRQFFGYKTDGSQIGRIDLNIFKTRDEYLKLGQGPPVEWSGGHFTGSAVETYIGGGGFEGMTGTLFHEAAHQFVSLATSASGWLNEGLASFFEGCAILANGTVLMNLPANHRLFPLVERMERGWMSGPEDGIDPANPSASNPPKAPTFRIVLENKYSWGPPWYAPTWGVVFFLYNYQDPVDGRYVYRAAFREFINSSGGRVGEGAVRNFEEVVLAQPKPPLKGVERPADAPQVALPATVAELDEVWKAWLVQLRDEQLGKVGEPKPWLRWALASLASKDLDVAEEHFEKGLVATPHDIDLNREFALFLAQERKNTDRAVKLGLEALRQLEARQPVDLAAVRALERKLGAWDPKRSSLEKVQRDLWAKARQIVTRYRDADLPMMVMDTSWRFGSDLKVPGLFDLYAEALRKSGKSLRLWELAYNEKDLEGWDAAGDSAFRPQGTFLASEFGAFAADKFDFQMLTLDRVTSGDFSLEARVLAERNQVNFCGLVFGRKDATNFHALVLFPPRPRNGNRDGDGKSNGNVNGDGQLADSGFVDLASFYGGQPKTWRHNPVPAPKEDGGTSAGKWHTLRIDVAGRLVDAWLDGELIATQEFPSLDVLRGRFGLITGPGAARYREVRFMSVAANDPAASVEREVRMERLAAASGGAIAGSWLGKEPPFPKTQRWVREPRSSWAEAGRVPQLMVLWSIQQNDILRIDPWLNDLAQRYGENLRIVSVCSPNDDEAIEAYLAQKPFPGAVGVDLRQGFGFGETNEAYFTPRFNLPRLLLLDVDQRVAWEGDPGISAKEAWKPGDPTYLDTPLDDLLSRRRLLEMRAWVEQWLATAKPAMSAGNLEAALPILEAAGTFERGIYPDVDEAQRRLEDLKHAVARLVALAEELMADGREPAAAVLMEWSALLKTPVEPREIRKALYSPVAKDWERALKLVTTSLPRIQKDPGVAQELASRLAELSGPFPAELAQQLREAGRDPARLARVLAEAPLLPRQWAASDLLGW